MKLKRMNTRSSVRLQLQYFFYRLVLHQSRKIQKIPRKQILFRLEQLLIMKAFPRSRPASQEVAGRTGKWSRFIRKQLPGRADRRRKYNRRLVRIRNRHESGSAPGAGNSGGGRAIRNGDL